VASVAFPGMCGIIAVLQRTPRRPVPTADELRDRLGLAVAAAGAGAGGVAEAAEAMADLDRLLAGTIGVRALLADAGVVTELEQGAAVVTAAIDGLDALLESGEGIGLEGAALESFNGSLVRLKDAVWSVVRDRVRTAREVAALAGSDAGDAAVDAFTAVQVALSAVDRLEVRGRDSAGLHLLVGGHGLDLSSPEIVSLLDGRLGDPLFQSMAVRTPSGLLSFAYKAAAEIGELGDNTAALRAAVAADRLLHRALVSESATITVLGHTRWASVGVISEANAHPLNSDEADSGASAARPYVTAALNGDVDNYAELRDAAGLSIPSEVTTDAKVIPTLVSRRMAAGQDAAGAFVDTVASFDGSVAIAASVADEPDRLLLALRGSGQALYVGVAEDAFVVASEPYGLVEQTPSYLRIDGETPGGPTGTPGQVIVLDREGAGTLDGIRRLAYDGTELPVDAGQLSTAGITTRDIDRGEFTHYLLKELHQAPGSFRKTLRRRLVERDGRFEVVLDDAVIPPAVRDAIVAGGLATILVIGQGTAAIAGETVAKALANALAGSGVAVRATAATELSGFHLVDEMDDTLVVAISQSGTTTDTNRAVDLARARGAAVIAIVNRRGSDLTDKADGVLYTSDGRDVEMAVPSTKAFYMQVAAGFLLAAALGRIAGTLEADDWQPLFHGLRDFPAAMEAVLAKRPEIAAAAAYGPPRRHWSVVGNGDNSIAAAEIRIKLSELCYKSIGRDSTEDKKHIDLSAEPLIFMCAAGLSGANAADAAKEVAMWRAHKAAPIVVATDGVEFPSAVAVIHVPAVHDDLAFVLSAMVGHLFGYEAALAIDAQALPLRELRGVVEAAMHAQGDAVLHQLAADIEGPSRRFLEQLRAGAYNGHLEVSTALLVTSLLRFAQGQLPLDAYELDFGVVGTPKMLLDDFGRALTKAIDELTRPIDAIKHQAKTITVGTSRSEEDLFSSALVQSILEAGVPRDRLNYRSLRTLAALDPAIARVTGYTRYVVDGDPAEGNATITVVDKGGVAAAMTSRAEHGAPLQGTKNRAARQRWVTAVVGFDGRTLVHVPETKGTETTGITSLHVEFVEHLEPVAAARVLDGYQDRLAALREAVTESQPAFDQSVLGAVPVVELLTAPVHFVAAHWRSV
jgi:glucosamine--fructose-6-phosphate aminotransferase (isomerizing)